MTPARAATAIDNLRALIVVLVLAFHSVLAYLRFLPPHPFAFDIPPFAWRSFPIVDAQRFLGFDLFCAWLNIYLMSLFFLLSGLFVWPSLVRAGPLAFLWKRTLRLGLPFAAVVVLLMPLAQYPTYLQTAADPSVAAYWRHWLALPFWPSGPMWFLWPLIAVDIAAAGLYMLVRTRADAVLRLSAFAGRKPGRFLAAMALASALAYLPLALALGSSSWRQWGPFSLQISRPLHYVVYFFAGAVIGACGIERGLVAVDGSLARRALVWLVAAIASFAAWVAVSALTFRDPQTASLPLRSLEDLAFVAACFASCILALTVGLRSAALRSPLLDSLRSNAYGIFLVHYVFVVWLQYALVGRDWPGPAKAALVFGGTLLLSWCASAALCRVPAIAQVIGTATRRPVQPVRGVASA
jgi:peptidoglycan/LPS O-acetylase OafA/YrhL